MHIRRVVLVCLSCLSCLPCLAFTQQVAPSSYSQLTFRHVGPRGNRVTSVAGVAGDVHVYYAGAASGGVWKTSDGGTFWEPVFDDQPVQSIGAIEVAPSDRNIVWVGTGEAHIRSHISIGNGVYKSTEGGTTWTHMGLEATGRIARIAIHPTNPDVVYVASQGHSYGPQRERGIFRTTDGGRSWEHVLHVSDSAGASDLAMDPVNPRILYAGFWQIEIRTWGRESGGPHSGIWKSTDGGDTWTRLRDGLPARPHGKVALAVAPSNPQRLYALIETGDGVPIHGRETDRGELWRSDNGGERWERASYDRNLAGRTQYYSRVEASPADENEVYFLSAAYAISYDGGRNAEVQQGRTRAGFDHHDMWIDPSDADRMAVGHDGGVSISSNSGKTWRRVQLPIAQMYHVTADTRVPYYVYGNMQDGPSARGPSRTNYGGFGGGSIPRGDWHAVGGGESGWATPDPEDPNIIWSTASGAGARGGIVVRYEEDRRQYRHVEVWPQSTGGWPAEGLRYRFVWDFPLHISPHDHDKVYVGSQHVHVTTDGGHSWQVISPDLTLNDKSRQGISGGLTPDNIGVEYAGTIYRIAESPVEPGLIWAGTNDGQVQVTRNGGETWTNVTRNISNLPPWGTISFIEPSRHDAATAYLSVDFHQVNGRDPHLYRTTDLGRSWRKIVNGIPVSPLTYTRVIREDPVRRGLLYAGTENAIYVSFNDGQEWRPLQQNLPAAPVYMIVFQEHFNDMVVGTYGRGIWIMDDISALQQLTPQVAASDAHLFELHDVYRFRGTTSPWRTSDDPTEGNNPPYGAPIDYWLKAAADSVAITIADAEGNTVRSLSGKGEVGINRVYWNLRGEPTTEARLRTSPLYAPDIEVGDDGTRNAPGLGRITLLMPPGTYTVKLAVGGRELTRPLTVIKDPSSGGTLADIMAQHDFVQHLQEDLNRAVDAINRMELVRSQLQTLQRTLAAAADGADLIEAGKALEQQFTDLEMELYQLKLTGEGQDGVRWPAMTAQRIQYLAGTVDESDHRPTTQADEVHEVLHQELEGVVARLDALTTGELARFNQTLAQRGMVGVVTLTP
jgi:photosystem II stability/assembly factor-like uncharacterized protein